MTEEQQEERLKTMQRQAEEYSRMLGQGFQGVVIR